MKNINFWILSLGLNIIALAGIVELSKSDASRHPASAPTGAVTLEIKSIQLPANTKIDSIKDVSLIATFNRVQKLDLLGAKKLSLNMGQSLDLNINVDIESKWIKDDRLEFKIELVKLGFIDKVILRCAQVSKKVSEYNRSYQCFLPENAESAVLTYRISTDANNLNTGALAKK